MSTVRQKKRGITTAPRDLKFGNKPINNKKRSFQTKTTNYSSSAGNDFTVPGLWKSFGNSRDPRILLNSMLYSKYSSSQNYHYLKDINDILLQERTPVTLAYRQSEDLLNQSENLDTFFQSDEYEPQMEDIVEYYKYHNEIPRYFGKNIYQIYFDHYDKKRKLNYKRITRKMKVENGEDPDESQERELAVKRRKYYTPVLLNLTKTEEFRKREKMRRKGNLSNTIENIYRCFHNQRDDSSTLAFSTPRSINSISFKYTEMGEGQRGQKDLADYFEQIRKNFSKGREGKNDFKKKKKYSKNFVRGEKTRSRLETLGESPNRFKRLLQDDRKGDEKGRSPIKFKMVNQGKEKKKTAKGVLGIFEKLKMKNSKDVGVLTRKERNRENVGSKFSNAFKEFTSTFETFEPSGKKHFKSIKKSRKNSKSNSRSGSNFFKTHIKNKEYRPKKSAKSKSKSIFKKSKYQKSIDSTSKKSKNMHSYTNIFKNLKSFRSLDKKQKRKGIKNMINLRKNSKSKKKKSGNVVVKSQRHKRSKSDYNNIKSSHKKTVSYRDKYSSKKFIRGIESQALKKMGEKLKSRKPSTHNLKLDLKKSMRMNTNSLRHSRVELNIKNFDRLDYKTKLELFKQKRRPSKNSSIGTKSKNSSMVPKKKKKQKVSLRSRKEDRKRRGKILSSKALGGQIKSAKDGYEKDLFNGNIYEIRQKLKKRKTKAKREDLIKRSLNTVGLTIGGFKDENKKGRLILDDNF